MSYSYSSNVSKLNIYNIFVDINPNNYNFRLCNPSFFITDTVFLKGLVYNPNYYYWGIQNHKLKTKNTTFEKDDKHYYVSKNTTNPTRYFIKSDIFSKNDTTTVFKKWLQTLSLRQKPKTTVSLTNSLVYYSKFKNIFLSNTSENKHNSLNTFLDKHFFIKHSLSLSSNYSLKTPSKCSNKTALRRLEQSLQFLKNYKGYNYVKNSGQKNSQKKK
jgi:hypothetical protein